MPMQIHSTIQNGLSTTDQDGQHQEVHCGRGEGLVKALRLLLLSCHCRGSIDTLALRLLAFSLRACLHVRAPLLCSNSINIPCTLFRANASTACRRILMCCCARGV